MWSLVSPQLSRIAFRMVALTLLLPPPLLAAIPLWAFDCCWSLAVLPLFCSCLLFGLSRTSLDGFCSAFVATSDAVAAVLVVAVDADGNGACDAFVMLALAAAAVERVFESDAILLPSIAESALCAPSEIVGNCWCFNFVVDAFVLHCKIFNRSDLIWWTSSKQRRRRFFRFVIASHYRIEK